MGENDKKLTDQVDEMIEGLSIEESEPEAEPEPEGGTTDEGGGTDVKPEEGTESTKAGTEKEEDGADAGTEKEAEPPKSEGAEEAPKVEEDERDKRIKELEKDKEDLQSQLDKRMGEKKEEVVETPTPDEKIKSVLEDFDFDAVTSSREELAKFLKAFSSEIEQRTVNSVYRTLPTMVMKQSNYAAAMRESVNDFWNKNQDLKPVRRTVGSVANEIAKEHPEWAISKIFDEAGKTTREMLKMQAKAPAEASTTPSKPEKKDPAFADSKTRNTDKGGPPTKKSGIAEEIDEFLNL